LHVPGYVKWLDNYVAHNSIQASTMTTHQHAAAVCAAVTAGLRDLTSFEGAEFPGVGKPLIGGTVSVDFSGGRYGGVDVTLPSRSTIK